MCSLPPFPAWPSVSLHFAEWPRSKENSSWLSGLIFRSYDAVGVSPSPSFPDDADASGAADADDDDDEVAPAVAVVAVMSLDLPAKRFVALMAAAAAAAAVGGRWKQLPLERSLPGQDGWTHERFGDPCVTTSAHTRPSVSVLNRFRRSSSHYCSSPTHTLTRLP